MFVSEFPMGLNEGPASSLNYKRAILRSAPPEFTVEVLSPTKHGGNYSYGLKICPIVRSSNSSDSRSLSSRSTSSHSEYEIWRRWEDCLDFQVTLEGEYAMLSRQKVKVLRRAAHGKKKGDNDSIYSMRKLAASFDSLPEGPDPREVILDVHEIIPPLTRKGSFFRVSQATVQQRGKEWEALINGLFSVDPDAPVLLQELRNTQSVRDFFGYWRRDKELAEKAGKDVSNLLHSNRSRTSISTAYTATSERSAAPSAPTSPAFTGSSSRPNAGHLRHSASAQLVSTQRLEQFRPSDIPPASAPPQTANRRFIPESPLSARPSTLSHEGVTSADLMASRSMTFTDELLLRDERELIPLSSPVHPKPTIRGARQFAANPQSPTVANHTRYPSRPPPSELSPGQPSPNSYVHYPIPEEGSPPPRPIPRARSNSAITQNHRKGRVFMTASDLSIGIPTNRPNTASGYPTSPDPVSTSFASPSPSTPAISHRSPQTSLLSPTSSRSHATSVSSRFSNLSITRSSVTSSISAFTEASKRFSEQTYISEDYCESDDEDLYASFPTSPIAQHPVSPLYDIDEGGPSATPDAPSNTWRDSIASFSSMRTNASAEGVLPRRLRQGWSASHEPRRGTIDIENFVDSYYNDPDHSDSIKFSMDAFEKDLQQQCNDNNRHSVGSTSSLGSVSNTHSGSYTFPDVFAIKAAYHDHVIVFRADHNTSLEALRQRIQERFELHEAVPIKKNFLLAYVPSKTSSTNARARSNSVTSSISDTSQLRPLQVEVDWQTAKVTSNGKVTLWVLDAERQTPP